MRARSTQHCQGTTGRDLSIHCIFPLFYFLLAFFSTEYFALEYHSIAKPIYKRNCNFNSFLNYRQYSSIWEKTFFEKYTVLKYDYEYSTHFNIFNGRTIWKQTMFDGRSFALLFTIMNFCRTNWMNERSK